MPLVILPEVMQAIGKWLPSYSFGNRAWQIVAGKTPEVRNILILIGYMVVFMILSSYIRKKQEAV
ncbi:hypothetical protein [Bacillus gobiensis]|uniref:hypothetical protein n=1 Tax=Bacillus gobiensis TaxID=1441095 RepID=UPI003D1B773E